MKLLVDAMVLHFQIKVALAEDPGETKAAQACRQNLQAKTAMAEWLIGHLPWTIRAFPNRAAAGDPSARR